jgi:predicted amidohydrolase
MADRCGEEKRNGKTNKFIGQSEVVSPHGEILVRVEQQECIKIVDIDPGLALDKKFNRYNDLIIDRREDLYFK